MSLKVFLCEQFLLTSAQTYASFNKYTDNKVSHLLKKQIIRQWYSANNTLPGDNEFDSIQLHR